MHTSPDSKAVLERYVAAIEAGDEETIRDCFAEDATWHLDGDLPISGTWRGRETILGEFLAAAWSHYQPGSIDIEVTGIVAEGDRAVMQWTSRARTTAGAPYENRCIGVFTVRDGRIANVHEYMDTLYAHRTAFGAARAA
jgi:uncharacterized protein (TIGR02246 family)